MTRLGPRQAMQMSRDSSVCHNFAWQNLVRWPEWKYDATLGHAPTWHGKLLQAQVLHNYVL